MSVEIPLTRGFVAIVDDEDADLAALKWYAQRHRRTVYASRGSSGSRMRLHRAIGDRIGLEGLVDHINGDGLDNRRANLRSATNSQNLANRPRQVNNTSGFKGVSWDKRTHRWYVRAKLKGKEHFIGRFRDPVDAAKAYDRKVTELFGGFAYLNFPGPTTPTPTEEPTR